MELFYCHIIAVCTMCLVLVMEVSIVHSSESMVQLATVGKYSFQYCQRANFTADTADCGGLFANESRIMETCRKENYSNSCNVYTSPEDDSIFFCMTSGRSSQCINIRCNSTFKRETDFNPIEIIHTDTLSTSCVYKYSTTEPKECVTNSSDEGNSLSVILSVQVYHSCIVTQKCHVK
ncbi:uncharacterized protein LOC125672687 [Ostrea edulis]|uniref:uncharacterized protein LOC125672687 n=1 Tax=Ostrea edulis TaxID=37623 RepID=UPI0024AF7B29|nr:uncharacterized protein LOC125672687 [Ostrea edulis]